MHPAFCPLAPSPPGRGFLFCSLLEQCEGVGDHCGDQMVAGLRQEKVQQGVSYRLDGVEILAVQVEVIEGRQSDQNCRHTAVHADIEAAIV